MSKNFGTGMIYPHDPTAYTIFLNFVAQAALRPADD